MKGPFNLTCLRLTGVLCGAESVTCFGQRDGWRLGAGLGSCSVLRPQVPGFLEGRMYKVANRRGKGAGPAEGMEFN